MAKLEPLSVPDLKIAPILVVPLPELKAVLLCELDPMPLPEFNATPSQEVEVASLPDLKALLFLKLEATPIARPLFAGFLPGSEAHWVPLPLPLFACTRSVSRVLFLSTAERSLRSSTSVVALQDLSEFNSLAP